MSKPFAIAFGSALFVILILVWIGFSTTKGNHLAPTGKIGKIRVQKVTDDVSFMVIDFSMKNDSDRDMVVHSISATAETAAGNAEGTAVAAKDINDAFHGNPDLGDQYNAVLRERDILPAHQSFDRMVGIRFDYSAEQIENRKRLVLRIQDATGPVLELIK